MNKDELKKLIKETVLKNRRENSVLLALPLSEGTKWTQYGRAMDMFSGDVENVDQVVIMTPENPHAKPLPPEQNEARVASFKEEMSQAGYGWRLLEGMYEGPENSYLIPHMSRADAAKFSYKWGQESFVYSIKQTDSNAKMIHEMVVIKYAKKQQDPAYPIEQYGPVYIAPPQVMTITDAEATKVLNMQDLHSAPDYYSNIPGAPEDTRFSMDFYGPSEPGQKIPSPKNPRYIRESTFIYISESEVPKTRKAFKLLQSIRRRCKMVNESARMGSSRHHHRKMIMVEKRKLQEMIKEQNDL